MTLDKITNMAYSIQLHKNNPAYNAIKYSFNVPKNFTKQLDIFFEKHKFNLNELRVYNDTQVQMRLIISYFINNKQIPVNCSNKDYELFVASLTEYKNEITLAINRYKDIGSKFSFQLLYQEYVKKQIPFYVFYYCMRYVNINEDILKQELIKKKLIIVSKFMMFFKHFDKEWIKEQFKDLENHINLTKI